MAVIHSNNADQASVSNRGRSTRSASDAFTLRSAPARPGNESLERGIPKGWNPAIAVTVLFNSHVPGKTCMERLYRHLFRDRHVVEFASGLHRERLIDVKE